MNHQIVTLTKHLLIMCCYFFFFLLSSLTKSRGNVSVYLKSKLTIKGIVPFSTRVSTEQEQHYATLCLPFW